MLLIIALFQRVILVLRAFYFMAGFIDIYTFSLATELRLDFIDSVLFFLGIGFDCVVSLVVVYSFVVDFLVVFLLLVHAEE